MSFFCQCFRGSGAAASLDEGNALQNSSSTPSVQRPAAASGILSFCSRQSQGWDVSATERARAAGSRTRKDADVVQLATARYMQLFAAAKNDEAPGVASLYDTDVRAMQDSVRSVRSGSDGASGHVAPREYSRQAASREGSSRLAYSCGPGPPGPPSGGAAHSLHRRSVSSVRHDSPALDALPEQATSEAAATGGSGGGEFTSYPVGAATGSFKKSGSLSRVLGPFTSKGNLRSPAGTPRSTSDRAIAAASALPAPLASPSTKSMSRANTGGGVGGALQALGLGRLHGTVAASASYNDLRVGARTSSITNSATGPVGQGQGQGQGPAPGQGQVSRAGSIKGGAGGAGGLHGTASSRRSRMFNDNGPAGAAAGGGGGGSGSISAAAAAALSGGVSGVSSMPMGVAGGGAGGGGGAASSNGYRQASVSAVLPAAAYLDSPATASSGGASGAMAAALSPYVMPGSGGGGGPGGGRRSTIFFSKNDVTVTGLPPSCLTSGRLPRCRDSTSGVLMQMSGGAAGPAAAGGAAGGGVGGFGPQSSRLGRNSTDLTNMVARTASAVVPPSSQAAMLSAAACSDYHHHNQHVLVNRSGMSMDLGRASRNGLAMAAAHRNGAGAGLQHAASTAMLSALTGGGHLAHGFCGGPMMGRVSEVPTASGGERAHSSQLGARFRVGPAGAGAASTSPRAGGELGSRAMSAQLEHGSPRARLTQQGQPPEGVAHEAQPAQLSAPLPLAQPLSQPLPQPAQLPQPPAQAQAEPAHAPDATAAAAAAATAAAVAAAASANSSEAGARCDWVGSSLYAPSRCSDSSRLTNLPQPGGNGAGAGLVTTGTATIYNDPSSCALATVQAPASGVGGPGVGGGAAGDASGSYVRQGTSNAAAADHAANGGTGSGRGGGTGTGMGGAGSRALSQHTGGSDARLTPGGGPAAGAAARGEMSTQLSSVMVGDESSTANNSSLLAPLPPGADLAAATAAASQNNPLFGRISASGRSGAGPGYTGHSNALFSALPDGAVSGANALNAAAAASASAAAAAAAGAPPPASGLPVVVQLPANSALALATEARDVTSALNRLQEACLLAQKVDVSQRLTKRISLSIEHSCGPPGARPSAAGWASSMHGMTSAAGMGGSAYGAFGGGGSGMSASLGPGLPGYSFTNNIVAGRGAGGPPTEGRTSYTRTTSASAALMAARMGRAPPRASLSRSHLAGGGGGAAAMVAARAGGGMPGAASAIVGYLEDINSEPWVDTDHPDHPDNSDQPSRMRLRTGPPCGDEDDGDGDGGGIVMDGSALFMAHDGMGSMEESGAGMGMGMGVGMGMGFSAALVPAMLYAGSSVVPAAASSTGAGGMGFGNGGFGNGGSGVSQSYNAVLMASAAGDGGGFGRRSSNIGGGGSMELPAGARTMAAVMGAGAYGSTGSAGVGVGGVGGGYSSQGRHPQARLRDEPSDDPQTQAMLNVLLQGDFLESKDSGLPASDDEDDGPVEYRYGGFELGGGAEGGDDYRRQHSFVEAVRRIDSERGGRRSPAGSPSGANTPGVGAGGRTASVVGSGPGGRNSPRNSPRTALARRAVVNNLVGSGVAASGGSASLLGVQLRLDGGK